MSVATWRGELSYIAEIPVQIREGILGTLATVVEELAHISEINHSPPSIAKFRSAVLTN